MLVFDRCSRLLDERSVLHAGGTGGLAGHASEARVEVFDHRLRHRNPILGTGLHQVYPTARRVHLLAEELVTWTSGQAKAAMHALIDERRQGLEGAESGQSLDPSRPSSWTENRMRVELSLHVSHQR